MILFVSIAKRNLVEVLRLKKMSAKLAMKKGKSKEVSKY